MIIFAKDGRAIKWTGVSPVEKGLKSILNSFFYFLGMTFKPNNFPSHW